MPKIGLFYGTTTGNTERVAKLIKEKVEISEIINIAEDKAKKKIKEYTHYMFGVPSWYEGDVPDVWKSFLPVLKSENFEDKKGCIFGLGNQKNHPTTFVSGMRKVYDVLVEKGMNLYGMWDTKGYEFKHSDSIINGKFIGLALDEITQPHLTSQRIEGWIEQLKKEGFFR